MLKDLRVWVGVVMLFTGVSVKAQRIVYSEPERDDSRRMNFEIIGKFGSNFLIYKNNRNRDFIAVYDNDMKQIGKVEMDYIPDDRLINVDFFPYTDYTYVIYQYQRKNVVYCMSATIDAFGKKVGEPVTLDTTHIGFAANNKLYSTISSEDKSKIVVFKINSRNKENYIVTTVLFNDKLELIKRSVMRMAMEERNDYLDQFYVDNDGDIVFAKFKRSNNDNIENVSLVVKPALSDSLIGRNLDLGKNLLDEIHIKVDNYNKRYFLTSFYYKQRRGNIDGFYFYVWDKASAQPIMQNILTFSEELRKEAKGDANIKMAFNDYFIKNVIIKRDGGFIIGSEAYYTTSRYNSWNRWDYMYGSPFMSPYDYYYYSPYYSSMWWRNNNFRNNQAVRSHADNIVILSFANDGKLEWSNVISKDQFDDDGDFRVSYQLVNTGGQLHFLFNQQEKRMLLLNDYSVVPDGQINRNPTLKNLDKGYEFMPKYGKQVSSKQIIIPCIYRNYICFAKIDYN
ncbi:MAG: hypothetical protein JNL23_12280 [Chitinophagaceae bacterium]|nr:hypothetical protein [Chitinophagaceae bacterium]